MPPAVTPELPTRTWRVLLALLARLPQGVFSRGFGALADVPVPAALRPAVLGAFARSVGMNLAEAERPLTEYASLNELFVRRLRAGARQWPRDAGAVASPVDGILGQVGEVEGGRAVQAKGRWYSVAELLGDDTEAAGYEGGVYVTLYLSPRHYHRIHTPCAGAVVAARHVPGALLPVNAPSVAHVPDLFARNERLVCYLEGVPGRVAVVAVGAYNVGRISAAFDPHWAGDAATGLLPVTNRRGAREESRIYHPPIPVAEGAELMAFHLGSTVVLLFPPGRVSLLSGIAAEREVQVGQAIAQARSEVSPERS